MKNTVFEASKGLPPPLLLAQGATHVTIENCFFEGSLEEWGSDAKIVGEILEIKYYLLVYKRNTNLLIPP